MNPFRRKTLILVVVGCAATVALLNTVVDQGRLKYYQPGSARWNLNAYSLQRSRQEVDILFLGSSRVLFGVNAKAVEAVLEEEGGEIVRTFNVAQIAAGVVTSQILLRDLIASNGCPRLVVLEVSPGGLNHNGVWWEALPDQARAQDLLRFASTIDSLERLDYFLAGVLSGGLRLYDRLAEAPDPEELARQLQFRGSRFSALSVDDEASLRAPGRLRRRREHRYFRRQVWRDLELGGAPARALESVYELTSNCSANLVLVRLPTLIWFDPLDLETVDSRFQSFIHEFISSRQVRLFEVDPGGVNPNHFGDPVHLNRAGSLVFSRRLAKEVLLSTIQAGS